MSVCKIIFALLTALAAVNFIFAEDTSNLAPDQTQTTVDKPPNKGNENSNNQESVQHNNINTRNAFNNCTNYCINCRQALLCYSNLRSVVRTCHGRFRYCIGGRCSYYPAKECSFE